MSLSFIHPLTCGFAKCAAHFVLSKNFTEDKTENIKQNQARAFLHRYEVFKDIFKDREDAFDVEYKTFLKNLQALRKCMTKWSRNGNSQEKKTYLETFALEKWQKLSNAKKEQHSLSKCKGCYHHFPEVQAMFPVKSNFHKTSAKENPFFQAKNLPKITGTALKDSTKKIYNCVNKPFEKTFGLSFAEAQTKVPDINLQQKPTKLARKQELRTTYQKVKSQIQEEWNKTSVER